MRTHGIFFLRRRPATTRFQSPSEGPLTGWAFLLGERHSQRGVQTLVAYWRGEEADRFMQVHADLKPGDCLDIELDRLHAAGSELCGFITRCALAPERWPGRGSGLAEAAGAAEHAAVSPALARVH